MDTFPQGQFKFNPAALIEAKTHAPVAVSFKIGNGWEHVIEIQLDRVLIYKKMPENLRAARPARGARRTPILQKQFVYSGMYEPFITGPSDLTRAKLSKLVEMAIEKP